MSWLNTIVLLLTGAAAAASTSESIARGARRRQHKAHMRRGMILPKEAARELERRIGGRVAVGIDQWANPDYAPDDFRRYKLVIMRHKRGAEIPKEFGGYRVEIQPKITLVEGW